MRASITLGAMGPPPPPYRATEVLEDEARLQKRQKTKSSSTCSSTDIAQFAPIPNAATQSDQASQQLAATTDDGSSSQISHTYSPRAHYVPHNVLLYSNAGIRPGDYLLAEKAEPLGNQDYNTSNPQFVFHARGDYLTKERFWVVHHLNSEDMAVQLATTFGDSDMEEVRKGKIVDESLGPRHKLEDFMQVMAEHHPGKSPAGGEPLCYGEDKTPLRWKGPGRYPSKKISYVRLSATETLTIGNVGFKLVGSLSDESTDRLLEATASLSKAQHEGTQKALKRMREESHKLSSTSKVCLHLSFVEIFYANTHQRPIPPPTPAFGSDLASTLPRGAGTGSTSANTLRPSVTQLSPMDYPRSMPREECEQAATAWVNAHGKPVAPASGSPPGTSGMTRHMSGLGQSLGPNRGTADRTSMTEEQECKHTSRNQARKAKSKAKKKEKEKGDAQPPQPAALSVRDQSTTVNNIQIDTANGDIVGACGHNTDYHQTHQSQERQAQQFQQPQQPQRSPHVPRRQGNFRPKRHVDSYRPSY